MSEVYLFQTIHTLDGTPLRLSEHIAVLDTASRALFRRPFSGKGLDQSIRNTITNKALHTNSSIFIRVELTPTSEVRLSIESISLYRGYALRSLHPDAITTRYDLPFGEHPTSAREALATLASQQASLRGARCAVRCSADGVAISCDDAPLFAIKGAQVYTSPAPKSVERSLACECIQAAGFELIEEQIAQQSLTLFDELFTFDHRGIMSLAHCDEHPYMSLVTERIAMQASRIDW